MNEAKYWKIIGKGLLVALIIAALIGSYYTYNLYYPSTNDAYIGANLLDVSAKADGFIQNIYVENNQFVKKGQLLLEINPNVYKVNLNKVENDRQYAISGLNAQAKAVQIAQTNLNKAKSDYTLAKQLAIRYQNLYQSQSGSKQDMQMYTAKAEVAIEQVKQTEALLETAKQQYAAAKTQIAVAENNIQTAQIYASYTKVFAPVDGYVSNLNLVTGQLIKAGEPIFGLIDNNKWWVDANFKETQLNRIKIGQRAEVILDMYSHKYHGIVKSISYASGNTFALLPSENATGNWVKVTQRFTVRVQLQNDNPTYPLRVGSSADVTIDTRSKS